MPLVAVCVLVTISYEIQVLASYSPNGTERLKLACWGCLRRGGKAEYLRDFL